MRSFGFEGHCFLKPELFPPEDAAISAIAPLEPASRSFLRDSITHKRSGICTRALVAAKGVPKALSLLAHRPNHSQPTPGQVVRVRNNRSTLRIDSKRRLRVLMLLCIAYCTYVVLARSSRCLLAGGIGTTETGDRGSSEGGRNGNNGRIPPGSETSRV
ncbi:unnamed protein product [Arctogadus glacialis]